MRSAMKKTAMKPAMKPAMKAMKSVMKAAMKPAMKKSMKVKKVSVIAKGRGARAAVLRGSKEKTSGGLTKANLVLNKQGKAVAKSASARGKKNWASSPLKKWSEATKQARKELKITGFCAVGGSSAQGKALYAKVKSIP